MTESNDRLVESATTTTTTAATATISASQQHPPPPVTEAQLRWAQFHHKRNAIHVQQKVKQFWLTPASPSQVPGAVSDDGRSTTTEEEEENDNDDEKDTQSTRQQQQQLLLLLQKERQQNKPVISRGRRALLRVSKRALMKRKDYIAQHGFACNGVLSSLLSFDEEYDDNNNDHDLAAIFAEERVRRRRQQQSRLRRRRQRRRRRSSMHGHYSSSSSNEEEEERIRRFESAFRAMMETLAAAAKPAEQNSITPPTKKWMRPTDPQQTVDGREYIDLKWGVMASGSNKKQQQHQQQQQHLLLDRGASWLVHSMAFQNHPNGTARSPYEGDEQRRMQGESFSANNSSSSSSSPHKSTAFLQRRQMFEEGSSQQVQQEQIPGRIVPIPQDAVGFVQQFVAQIEQAALTENLISADGKLHKATFAKLVMRYLGQASASPPPSHNRAAAWKSPTALAKHTRKSVGSIAQRRYSIQQQQQRRKRDNDDLDEKKLPDSRDPQNHYAAAASMMHTPSHNGFVQNFIAQLEKAVEEEESLVTAEGKLDTTVLERLVTQYLAQAADLSLQQQQDESGAKGGGSSLLSPSSYVTPRAGSVRRASLLLQQCQSQAASDFSTTTPRMGRLSLVLSTQGKESSPDVASRRPNRLSRESYASFDRLGRNDLATLDKEQDESSPDSASPPQKRPVRESYASFASSAFGEIRQWNQKLQFSLETQVTPPRNNQDVKEGEYAKQAEGSLKENALEGLIADGNNTNESHGRDSQYQNDAVSSDVAHSTLSSDKSLDTSSKVSDLANRLAGSVSNRVGGWMKILNNNLNKNIDGKNDDDDDDDNNTEAEMEAVAAFHKTQDGRRTLDDNSSTSSFRVLPEGIKKVVKNFGGPRFQTDFDDSYVADDSTMMESVQEDQELGAASFETTSSYRTTSTTSIGVVLSPERLKEFHNKMMEKSALLGGADADQTIIDTDGNSDISGGMPGNTVSNLLLSPTILTKRHQQAIRAIENRSWEQVFYLMSANPWLAEMNDVKSGQYLLHKLAYYGAGEVNVDMETGEVVSIRHPAAPEQINKDLIRMFSSAVHKFDQDGNLPLHFACASGNLPMMSLLGDRFPGGASVRNEDGMLPLHLAILACAAPISAFGDSIEVAVETVKTILSYFPSAVGVADNEGNLAIHTAANVLVGDVGVEIVFLLLDEAERQIQSESGVRFRNKVKFENMERTLSGETESTATPTDSAYNFDEVLHCTLVYNDRGQTPLTAAIYARAGWEVIEALSCGQGGARAALCCDAEKNTALHLLSSTDFLDPEAILSILKLAPEVASVRNVHGMLPIEVACMQNLSQDIVAAILLADLPIELDRRHDVKLIEGKGASWWYLACDCDDFYVDLVEELIRICTFQQSQALCSIRGPSGDTLIERATPLCRSVLQSALRLEGRFELNDSKAVYVDSARGVKVFNALDFGDPSIGESESKIVLLKSFARREAFEQETSLLQYELNFSLIEEVAGFECDLDQGIESPVKILDQYFISIEQPNLTLRAVMDGMLQSEACQNDETVRQRYALKVFAVLRIIAKAIRHLHSLGFVHGNVNLDNCRRYDEKWKLANALESQEIGSPVRISRLSSSSPPECIEPLENKKGAKHLASFRSDYVCSPAMDCWGFGKLSYEALAGRSLVQLDKKKRFEDDHRAMMDLLHWNSFNCDEIRQELQKVGVPENGADLISLCLSPDPDDRPSMEAILANSIWRDLRDTKRTGEA